MSDKIGFVFVNGSYRPWRIEMIHTISWKAGKTVLNENLEKVLVPTISGSMEIITGTPSGHTDALETAGLILSSIFGCGNYETSLDSTRSAVLS